MLDTIELSKKLISFESVTPAKQDIFDFLIQTFQEKGFTTKQLNFDGDGSYEVINLMATFGSPNTNAKHFNFLCHVDVVPPGNIEDWDTPPFEPTIKDGYLYGRGSEDMKGCTAASMVSVFKFLKDNPDFMAHVSAFRSYAKSDYVDSGGSTAATAQRAFRAWPFGLRWALDIALASRALAALPSGSVPWGGIRAARLLGNASGVYSVTNTDTKADLPPTPSYLGQCTYNVCVGLLRR